MVSQLGFITRIFGDREEVTEPPELLNKASSNVRIAVYFPSEQRLEVTFHSGARYAYYNFPPNAWTAFKNIRSFGQAVWIILRNHGADNLWGYQKIGQGTPTPPEAVTPQVAQGPDTTGPRGTRARRGSGSLLREGETRLERFPAGRGTEGRGRASGTARPGELQQPFGRATRATPIRQRPRRGVRAALSAIRSRGIRGFR